MTKKAVGYKRISTKDQSNFSLNFQDNLILNFGVEKEIDIVKIFTDDGYSAKNFDRPDWQELELFIKQNYKEIDYLIVAKYDRFGRNVVQSLQKIEMLENKYKIRVISVLENIGLHPESPYFFKIRTDMLTGAQTEWLQIKERTKSGIRMARLAGRTVNAAPIGYVNRRDEKNKPIIVVDQDKAVHIKKLFSLFLQGYLAIDIYRQLKADGLNLQSRTIIMKILANPTYAGLVKVPASYDEPEQMVKGIHEALISESDWWRVQALIKERPRLKKHKEDERFPLRGLLQYTNGRLFTSYHAQGKCKKVPYYRVFKPDKSINANLIHRQMDEILHLMTIPVVHQQYMFDRIRKNIEEQAPATDKEIKKTEKEIKSVLEKMQNIEEDRISRTIDANTFMKWHYNFSDQKEKLEQQLLLLRKPKTDIMKHYEETLPLLTDLHYLYSIATIPAKQELISTVFDKNIQHDGVIYRTPSIYPTYLPKAALLKEKRLLEIEQPLNDFSENGVLYRVRESNP